MKTIIRSLVGLLVLLTFTSLVFAATEIAFSITGMDPVEVMRFQDPEDQKIRVGYIQSTEFSHSIQQEEKQPVEIEDGIFYYSVLMEKLPDGTFQMDIAYDFASSDGTSRGIRNRSIVTEEILKSITAQDIQTRAGEHATAFANVVYENFLKGKLTQDSEEIVRILSEFFTGISKDLLKSMPKDGVKIIRRGDDLVGRIAT